MARYNFDLPADVSSIINTDIPRRINVILTDCLEHYLERASTIEDYNNCSIKAVSKDVSEMKIVYELYYKNTLLGTIIETLSIGYVDERFKVDVQFNFSYASR